jgi:tetratricopeptide (TPR) repeat protein
MKIVLLFLLPLTLSAQSLTQRFPYSAPVRADSTPRLLDVRAKLAALPPVTIDRPPQGLPDELAFQPEELPWLAKLRAAHQHMSAGEHALALPLFEEFLQQFPQHAPTRVTYADCLFALGRYESAEQTYIDFLRDFPMHYQALNNLAWLYATTTQDPQFFRPDESLVLARKALLVSPESHHVWSTLSQAYYALRQYEEAAKAAETALVIAQRTRAGTGIEVNYLLHIEKCRAALLASSLME